MTVASRLHIIAVCGTENSSKGNGSMNPSHPRRSLLRTVRPQGTKAPADPVVREQRALPPRPPPNAALVEKWRVKFGLPLRRPKNRFERAPSPRIEERHFPQPLRAVGFCPEKCLRLSWRPCSALFRFVLRKQAD